MEFNRGCSHSFPLAQAIKLVTLRELLEMYGIAAAAANLNENANDGGIRNLFRASPQFVEVSPAQSPSIHKLLKSYVACRQTSAFSEEDGARLPACQLGCTQVNTMFAENKASQGARC